MDFKYKKRHRVPASCSVCRKRKSKCDRVKPVCGTCKKKSIAHLCYYEESKDGDKQSPSSDMIIGLPPIGQHQTFKQQQSMQQIPQHLPQQHIPQQHIPQQHIPQQHVQQQHIRAFPPPPIMDSQDAKPVHFLYSNQQNGFSKSPQENEMRNPYTPEMLTHLNTNMPIRPPSISSSNSIPSTGLTSQEQSNLDKNEINTVKREHQIDELKPSSRLVSVTLGQNSRLLLDPEDTIRSFRNASFSLDVQGSEWKTEGYISFTGLSKRDPFLKIWRSFIFSLLTSGKMSQFIKLEKPAQSNNRKRKRHSDGIENNKKSDMENDLIESDGIVITKLKSSTLDNTQEQRESFEEMSSVLSHFNAYFSGSKCTIEYYSIIENLILKVLPSKRTLSILLDRYFMYVYPFSRIFDKESFMRNVKSFFDDDFPSMENEYYSELSIENDGDLYLVAILLIMARLGYMSAFHTNSEYDDLRRDELISHDMYRFSKSSFKRIISVCTSNSITVTSSIRYIQLLTLLYFYKRTDPSDALGLGGADGQILLGIITRHAIAIGLNRDPSFYVHHDPINKRPELMQTWRLLWRYILFLDAYQSIACGVVLNIPSHSISDVKFPDINCFTNEIKDAYKITDEISEGYRRIVRTITNFNEDPKVIDLLSEATHLEEIFSKYFGKEFFKHYICDTELASISPKNDLDIERCHSKVIKYCNFIQLRTNLSSIYSIIAIHYENENKTGPSLSTGVELFKIYIKSVLQLVFVISHTLENSVDFFGKNYDYVLTEYNERCLSRSLIFLCSFFVRLIHHKRDLMMKSNEDPEVKARLEVIGNLYNLIILESDLFVGNFKDLSGRYSNSFRLAVVSKLILQQCVSDPNAFFENKYLQDKRFLHNGTNLIEYLSNSELQYLCNFCEEFKSAKSKQNQILKVKRENRFNGNFNRSLSSNWCQSDSGVSNKSSSVQASPDTSSVYSIASYNEQMQMGEQQLLQLFKLYGPSELDDFDY